MNEQQNPQRGARTSAHGLRLRQAMMGQSLRSLFDTVANEPIPDDFQDLLRELDKRGSEAV